MYRYHSPPLTLLSLFYIFNGLLFFLSTLLELKVTVIVDYTPAQSETPEKLGPNEFTAGSHLTLICVVRGHSNSDNLRYHWSVAGSPSTPGCTACSNVIPSATHRVVYHWKLYSWLSGNYSCSAREINKPEVYSNSFIFIVKVVGKFKGKCKTSTYIDRT